MAYMYLDYHTDWPNYTLYGLYGPLCPRSVLSGFLAPLDREGLMGKARQHGCGRNLVPRDCGADMIVGFVVEELGEIEVPFMWV